MQTFPLPSAFETNSHVPAPGWPVAAPSLPCPRVRLFDIDIAQIGLAAAVKQIQEWCRGPRSPCRYVVTPNVDHLVILNERADFRAAYTDADLVLADGWPVVLASRLLGRGLPERVAGSDVVPALFQGWSTESPLRVYLLGAAPGVAEEASRRLSVCPGVMVAGSYSPPPGFENDERENQFILQQISCAAPDLLLVGLGAPKQELWVHTHRRRLHARVAFCGGAVIDFLAGSRVRAPRWMQQSGLEWLHRLANEPRRLARRYWRDACIFPQLFWREWKRARAR